MAKKYKRKTKKKVSNPFKLWGSYVGAYLLVAVSSLQTLVSLSDASIQARQVWNSLLWITKASQIFSINLIATAAVGFLIGWGIHSYFKKR